MPKASLAATLLGAADYITDDSVDETDVTHNVSFVIPLNGHDIVATDYIRIILTNFSSVTAPTSGSGWSGAPTFGATGNVAYVTGVTASTGGGIGISGITATNPSDPGDFDVTIQIANDINGTIVYDSATIDAEAMKSAPVVSVTVGTHTSSIELSGYTSPGAFVTILLDAVVAGTTVANGNGDFYKKLTGLEHEKNYSVTIYAQDSVLRQTQSISWVVYTLPFTNHIFSNITLPTTIELEQTVIYQGGILKIIGRGHPSSQITVFIDASYSEVVGAGSGGWWGYNFNSLTNPLTTGSHTAYAREVVPGGYTSILTQFLNFNVEYCIRADINCDGYVNLTDFSIMLYYWHHTNPANHRADISGNHYVDLTDFSIMMFHWTS